MCCALSLTVVALHDDPNARPDAFVDKFYSWSASARYTFRPSTHQEEAVEMPYSFARLTRTLAKVCRLFSESLRSCLRLGDAGLGPTSGGS